MRTTRPWLDEPLAGTHPGPAAAPAATGSDPLGTASGLRQARLDPDVLLRRAAHVVVDVAVLALLLAVPVLALLAATVLAPAPLPVSAAAMVLASASVVLGFTVVWPHHDGGRTAGMRWAGVRVVDRAGRPPGMGALLLRALVLPVDVVVAPVLVLVRPDRRRLGDLLAGTQVVLDVNG